MKKIHLAQNLDVDIKWFIIGFLIPFLISLGLSSIDFLFNIDSHMTFNSFFEVIITSFLIGLGLFFPIGLLLEGFCEEQKIDYDKAYM